MRLNRLVEGVLGEEAVELLDLLAAHALVAGDGSAALHRLPVEEESWNRTMLLVQEIFDAAVLVSGDGEWLSFRILQSFGVDDGRLVYQFTPAFAQALST